MRKVMCVALVLAACSVAQGADEWRDRFEKFREAELKRAKESVKEWEVKLRDKEAGLAAAKKKGGAEAVKRAAQDVIDHKVEVKRAADYAKEVEAKDWKPRKVALRTIEKGEFSYMIDAPVKVLQALPEGALVSRGTDTFFIRGLGDVIDGREYKMNGFIECTGTYKYTAVSGAAKTVCALQLHGK